MRLQYLPFGPQVVSLQRRQTTKPLEGAGRMSCFWKDFLLAAKSVADMIGTSDNSDFQEEDFRLKGKEGGLGRRGIRLREEIGRTKNPATAEGDKEEKKRTDEISKEC